MELSGYVQLPFYNDALSRDSTFTNLAMLQNVCQILTDPRIHQLAAKNLLTLALIRPVIGPDANLMRLSDDKISNCIEKSIGGLGMLGKFSFVFDSIAVENFYQGSPRTAMLALSPYRDKKFATKWHEFIDMMTAGPSTAFLLTGVSAIDVWRSQLGSWDVDSSRDEKTIRGRLATDNFNDLVHGSDSTESVISELAIIHNCVERGIRIRAV